MILRVQPQRRENVVRNRILARLVIFFAVRGLVSDGIGVNTGVLFHDVLRSCGVVNVPAQPSFPLQTVLVPAVDHVVAVVQNPVRPDIGKRNGSTICIINVVTIFGCVVVVKCDSRADFSCSVYTDAAAVWIPERCAVVRHSTGVDIQHSLFHDPNTTRIVSDGNLCTG